MQRVATPRRKNLQSNKTTRSKSWLRACVSWRTKTSSLIFNPKSAPGMILRCPTRLSTSLKNSKWIGHRSSKLTPFPESMTKRVKISSFKLQMVQEKHWLLVSLPSWELTPKLKESRCWSLQTPESWSGKFNRSFRKFAKTPRSHAVLETQILPHLLPTLSSPCQSGLTTGWPVESPSTSQIWSWWSTTRLTRFSSKKEIMTASDSFSLTFRLKRSKLSRFCFRPHSIQTPWIKLIDSSQASRYSLFRRKL